MIHLDNVTVARSGLQNLHLNIAIGDHLVIRGSNGSGKTLLLEVLSGIRHIAHGSIDYDFLTAHGWDERHKEKQRRIKYIPVNAMATMVQSVEPSYYQQRYYAGEGASTLVREVFSVSESEFTSQNIPGSLSVDDLLELPVARLSNGQLKKVLLIKSFMSGVPALLLMDYPYEGLDQLARRELSDFIDRIVEAYNTCIVIVDHHNELPRCINRVVQLDHFHIQRSFPYVSNPPSQTFKPSGRASSVTSEPIIELKEIRIQYGERIILDNFNWQVSKGERWALIGRNGAGKTTLLSMIFADHPMAYSQQVSLFGKRRGTGESIWDIKKRISYLGPEQMTFLNTRSLSLDVWTWMQSQKEPRDVSSLDKIIQYFSAEDLVKKPLRALSSGELQLALIMLALANEKELLLLDEPFRFLDFNNQSKVKNYLAAHLHQDTTLILITHHEQDVVDWTSNIKRL